MSDRDARLNILRNQLAQTADAAMRAALAAQIADLERQQTNAQQIDSSQVGAAIGRDNSGSVIEQQFHPGAVGNIGVLHVTVESGRASATGYTAPPSLDLDIGGDANGYTIALRSSVGSAVAARPLPLPLDLAALPQRADINDWVRQVRFVELRTESPELRKAKEFGAALFDALFAGERLGQLRDAQARLAAGERLRVRLALPDTMPELPWELLYDGREFFALKDNIVLIRAPVLDTPARNMSPVVQTPLRMLCVVASPSGQRSLAREIAIELATIEQVWASHIQQGRVSIDVIAGKDTYRQLQTRMFQPAHIVHMLCHGDVDPDHSEGALYFEDKDGDAEPVNAEALGLLLRRGKDETRLVLLNACHGASGGDDPGASVASALVRGNIPAVIAMQFTVRADKANRLTRDFYHYLQIGQTVENALVLAREDLYGADKYRLDWAIPVLFMRGTSSALFAPTPAARPVAAEPAATPPALPVAQQSVEPPPAPVVQPPRTRPDTSEIRRLRQEARIASMNGQWRAALTMLEQLVRLDPEDAAVQTRLAEARRQAALADHYDAARTAKSIPDWVEVRAQLDTIAWETKDYPDPDGLRAWVAAQEAHHNAVEQALDLCEQGEWAAVETVLAPFETEVPVEAMLHVLLARARQELAAVEARSAAVALQPAREALARGHAGHALALLGGLLNAGTATNAARALAADIVALPAAPTTVRVEAGTLLGQHGDPRVGVLTLPPDMVAFATPQRFQIGSTAAEADAAGPAWEKYWNGQNNAEQAKAARSWPNDEINDAWLTLAPFALARYLVTNAQYQLFIKDAGYDPSQPWWSAAARVWLAREDAKTRGLEPYQIRTRKDASEFWANARHGATRPNQPVVGVNWYEAMAFCAWLTLRYPTHGTYRLPSEAEWEYVARGTTRRPYPWGSPEPDQQRANFDNQWNGPTAVGCFAQGVTPEGLHDMAGNAWEWTRSEYKPYPYNPDDGRENEHGDAAQKRFTLRGGGWFTHSLDLRAASRDNYAPDNHDDNLGFRLALHPHGVRD